MSIVDYQTLEAEVKKYVYNRSDLTARLPTFVQIAERKIFRKLEHRQNEVLVDGNIDADNNRLALPSNYKSVKRLTVNGNPLTRISETRYDALLAGDNSGREPQHFCRLANYFKFWPAPDSAYAYELYYFAQFALNSATPTSTNDVLTNMPDLYLYGVLMEVAPYLGEDDRIDTWEKMLGMAWETVNEETSDEEYSGEVNQVTQPWGDG